MIYVVGNEGAREAQVDRRIFGVVAEVEVRLGRCE